MKIGQYQLTNPLILAPMAGITDKPFRELCFKLGAGMTVSEMCSSNPKVWHTSKSAQRMSHTDKAGVRSVQIAGADPQEMAMAAQFNVEQGAQIIDINMGCPAKKVNKKLAGSALLQHPTLVKEILDSVVNAVNVPVTLKIRTGWDIDNRNGVAIAQLAQDAGIQSLAVHGRTKACMYKGFAEFDTIKAIKQAISIPVVANGDITSPEKASEVLDYTGADAIMIGRGAQGNPWIFQEINHYLTTGTKLAPVSNTEVHETLLGHVQALHQFYGDFLGVRIARKHIGWYLKDRRDDLRQELFKIETASEQLTVLDTFFHQQI
ncbi:MAG: tRNA dihydrouridine synthase DusB [Gammaproteobacteria bacterium]|nr:tRNA dihydrouridine synthase DusB [Gammaproteobacteria bacterium]